jgi:hypothetical protein
MATYPPAASPPLRHSADARPRRWVHTHASAAKEVSTHACPGTCSSRHECFSEGSAQARAHGPAIRDRGLDLALRALDDDRQTPEAVVAGGGAPRHAGPARRVTRRVQRVDAVRGGHPHRGSSRSRARSDRRPVAGGGQIVGRDPPVACAEPVRPQSGANACWERRRRLCFGPAHGQGRPVRPAVRDVSACNADSGA